MKPPAISSLPDKCPLFLAVFLRFFPVHERGRKREREREREFNVQVHPPCVPRDRILMASSLKARS